MHNLTMETVIQALTGYTQYPVPKEGDIRVWWVPPIPMEGFFVPCVSIDEAEKVMQVLAAYDLFQYITHIKTDYSNAGGIHVFRDGKWEEL